MSFTADFNRYLDQLVVDLTEFTGLHPDDVRHALRSALQPSRRYELRIPRRRTALDRTRPIRLTRKSR